MNPLECHRHEAVWLASCEDCRDARRVTLALAAVQSCTVQRQTFAADQRQHRARRGTGEAYKAVNLGYGRVGTPPRPARPL